LVLEKLLFVIAKHHSSAPEISVIAKLYLFRQIPFLKEDIIFEHSQLSGRHIQLIYKIVTPREDLGVHDLIHLYFGSLELVLQIQELSIFDVYQVLVLYKLD
jgi:hypothetical protein